MSYMMSYHDIIYCNYDIIANFMISYMISHMISLYLDALLGPLP